MTFFNRKKNREYRKKYGRKKPLFIIGNKEKEQRKKEIEEKYKEIEDEYKRIIKNIEQKQIALWLYYEEYKRLKEDTTCTSETGFKLTLVIESINNCKKELNEEKIKARERVNELKEDIEKYFWLNRKSMRRLEKSRLWKIIEIEKENYNNLEIENLSEAERDQLAREDLWSIFNEDGSLMKQKKGKRKKTQNTIKEIQIPIDSQEEISTEVKEELPKIVKVRYKKPVECIGSIKKVYVKSEEQNIKEEILLRDKKFPNKQDILKEQPIIENRYLQKMIGIDNEQRKMNEASRKIVEEYYGDLKEKCKKEIVQIYKEALEKHQLLEERYDIEEFEEASKFLQSLYNKTYKKLERFYRINEYKQECSKIEKVCTERNLESSVQDYLKQKLNTKYEEKYHISEFNLKYKQLNNIYKEKQLCIENEYTLSTFYEERKCLKQMTMQKYKDIRKKYGIAVFSNAWKEIQEQEEVKKQEDVKKYKKVA